MQPTLPLSILAALFLALPGLRAANTASAPSAEQLTYHTDARFGRVLLIRNQAVQPTPADVARRVPQTPSPNGPLFNRGDLAKPEWTNADATARDQSCAGEPVSVRKDFNQLSQAGHRSLPVNHSTQRQIEPLSAN